MSIPKYLSIQRFLTFACVLLLSVTLSFGRPQPSPSRYDIGTLPNFTVWEGHPLEFIIFSKDLGVDAEIELESVSPFPKGAVTFDKNSALFRYLPSNQDNREFTVSFAASKGGNVLKQSVTITPRPHLESEYDIFTGQSNPPDPESGDYLRIREVKNSKKEFNDESQETRSLFISGDTITFDKTADNNRLYSLFNPSGSPRRDIEEVQLYANKVVLRSRMVLPRTNVTIYARELVFDDPTGSPEKAAIVTKPVKRNGKTAPNTPGLNGYAGGDISLRIQSITAAGTTKRLFPNGGDGQDAGDGQKGAQGTSMVVLHQYDAYKGNAKFKNVVYVSVDGAAAEGTKKWPADGDPGIPGGKPGLGGKGGTVTSTIDVSDYVDLSGGQSGEKSKTKAPGGEPGEPVESQWFKYWHTSGGSVTNWDIDQTHVAKKGPDTDPLDPDKPQGDMGAFVLLAGGTNPWLHPLAAQASLVRARDAYISGNLDAAEEILTSTIDLINSYKSVPGSQPDYGAELNQVRSEADTLKHRLANHLDYFGNPAGWVPMLSFEANMKAFSNEVDAAIPILYLSYWANRSKAEKDAKTDALKQTISNVEDDIGTARNQFNDLSNLVVSLRAESEDIAKRVPILNEELKERERQLFKIAEDNVSERHKVPFWKSALGTLAVICKVVPIYQPALAAIGTGLDVVSNIDSNDPVDTGMKLVNLADKFNDAEFAKSYEQAKTVIAAIDPSKAVQNGKQYLKDLLPLAQKLQESVRAVQEATKQSEAPRNEIEAELEGIKAQDNVFNDLIEKIRDLNARKESFSQRLAQATQDIATLSERITSNLAAVNTINGQLDDFTIKFDPKTVFYMNELERRSKDRLLKYQYYMAKAYEYRMLRRYQGNWNLNRTFSKLIEYVETPGKGHTQSEFDAIKAVYIGELRDVIASALDELESNPPEHSLEYPFDLSADELKALNENGIVVINLKKKLPSFLGEENRRIADLKISVDAQKTVGVPSGSDNVKLTFEHWGQSIIRSGGHLYYFNHLRGKDDRPFTWGALYNLKKKQTFQETLSLAGVSLLRSLLKLTDYGEDKMTLFINPGADAAEITIRRQLSSPGLKVNIDKVDLILTYDFFRRNVDQLVLDVEVADGLMPYISSNKSDVRGRRDGVGNFVRVFNVNDSVTLRAQPNYGIMKFKHWEDADKNILGSTPSLTLTLTSSTNVRAVYTEAH
jgi:hypothetical protein